MKRLTKETLFKPTRAESKQAATDETAWAMLEAEDEKRRKKTERLREMRLAAEAEAAGDEAKKGPAKKPVASRRKRTVRA